MNIQIADAKSRFFTDKDHYLAFRKAWSKSVNNETYLNGAHMLLYAVLRGKDARTAFVPITRYNKLTNGALINQGMYDAYHYLESLSYWRKDSLDTFLEPFNGTVNQETFEQVMAELPKVTPLYSNYGVGTTIAQKLWRWRSGDKIEGFDYFKHDLWDLIDIVTEQVEREHEERRKARVEGRAVSREEALQISRNTLDRAERERGDVATRALLASSKLVKPTFFQRLKGLFS